MRISLTIITDGFLGEARRADLKCDELDLEADQRKADQRSERTEHVFSMAMPLLQQLFAQMFVPTASEPPPEPPPERSPHYSPTGD